MKRNTTEREARLECLKIAASLTMQLRLSPKDVVANAKDYYEFLNASTDPVERDDNAKPYEGRVLHPMAERI